MSKGKLLHVGCGSATLPDWLAGYDEVRLDIDPLTSPDIVAPMDNLGDIGGFDIVLSIHAIEHVFPHEVDKTLQEFKRVLKVGGCAIVFVPDLTDIKPTNEVLYTAPCGDITGLDMYYGKASFIAENPFMAHKTGFTRDTLLETLKRAGFSKCEIKNVTQYNLMGVGVK